MPGHMTSTLHIQGLHRRDDGHAADAAQYALLPFAKAVQLHLNLPLLHLQELFGQQVQSNSSKILVGQSSLLRRLKSEIEDVIRQPGLPALIAEIKLLPQVAAVLRNGPITAEQVLAHQGTAQSPAAKQGQLGSERSGHGSAYDLVVCLGALPAGLWSDFESDFLVDGLLPDFETVV